jgi:cell division protein FtsQ
MKVVENRKVGRKELGGSGGLLVSSKTKKYNVRKRLLWFVVCLLGLLSCVFAFCFGSFNVSDKLSRVFLNVSSMAGFVCDSVNVEGIDHIKISELRNELNLLYKDSIFKRSTRDIFESLIRHPWIKNVIVHKALPNVITIRIEEKRPAAIFYENGHLFFVDEDGAKIARIENAQSGLLVIAGEDANLKFTELLNVIEQFHEIKKRVAIANFIRKRRWDLVIGKTTIKLPEHNLLKSMVVLDKLLSDRSELILLAKSIDLRIDGRVIIDEVKRVASDGNTV